MVFGVPSTQSSSGSFVAYHYAWRSLGLLREWLKKGAIALTVRREFDLAIYKPRI